MFFRLQKAGERVGVFDSGVGGLTVLAACMRRLPSQKFFYYGDNTHAPYGSRPPEEVERYVREAMNVFLRLRVSAAVLACNTATAVCAEKLRKEFPFPILGMEPAVAPAARVCRNVLVLATPLTASSRRLHDLIARFPDCRFRVAALPDLAGAIERYFAVREPLTLSDHLPEIACDGVVLGCTHYAFLRREIGMFYHAPVFDGAQGTANHLAELLEVSKNCSNSGTDDHPQPQYNPNKCFIKKYKKTTKNEVIFLGTSRKVNKQALMANICFKNF